MTVEFGASDGFTNDNTEIFYAGSPCTNVDASVNTAITCDLPLNSDNSPKLEAGS